MSSEKPPALFEDLKGRILDPHPQRKQHLIDIIYRFFNGSLSVADIERIPKRKLLQIAEIGFVKYKHGRYQEAADVFEMLVRLDHKNYYFHSALGAVYQKMKRPVDALTQYSLSLKLNGKDMAAYVNRGEIYLRHKKFKKAAQDFRSAILLDMKGRNLWANRARSLVIALKRTLDLRKAAMIHRQ
jgi:Flp pilus assembly protein TadD